jgi:nitroreductase
MNDSSSSAAQPRAAASRALLEERYAQPMPDLPGNAMIDTLLAHRTWRAFTSDPLPQGMVETLAAAAQSAATSSNLQTWSVVAIEDPARRTKLMELARGQKQIGEAPVTFCFVADLARLAAIADGIGHRREGLDYLELYLVAAIDSALAAQNLCVAAESFGLGTCYLGVLRNQPVEVAALIGLPPRAMVTFGVSVGWPDPKRPASIKPRLPQSAVLHRETYDEAAAIAPLADYEKALDVFNRRERNGQPLWGLRSSGRVAGPEILEGRENLAAILHAMGFPLK